MMFSLQGSSCTINEYLVIQRACFEKEKEGKAMTRILLECPFA